MRPLDRIPLARTLAFAVLLASGAVPARAQETDAPNYDESKVPAYTLPDPLTTSKGDPVKTADEWWKVRRPELLALIETQMYGRDPEKPARLKVGAVSEDASALAGKATRMQVTLHFNDDPAGPRMDLLLYLPNSAKGPVPTFLGLNFQGNQAVDADPGITPARFWTRDPKTKELACQPALEKARGTEASRWNITRAIERGYGVATVYYGDIEPDFPEGLAHGVRQLYLKDGRTTPAADEWGAIAAYAWGLSRVLDYLETVPKVDGKRVIVMGHSRLGKAALWAGAKDSRFALVISNDSGEGGAALSRRRFGEQTKRINTAFPHWFDANYKAYNDREDDLPFDQHEVIALIAPRPVLITSAEQDLWADPRGEFLAGLAADPVYRLLGTDGMTVRTMPANLQLVKSTIGYQIRPGKHDVTDQDWAAYLEFADHHLSSGDRRN